ncbi:MAG: hypothetical protein QOD32_2966 [Pyrinomonadaceae bacterium]|jgi:hypothetical protein|nr:hypothetical protein [Pyrinomonadaceae bacterium]
MNRIWMVAAVPLALMALMVYGHWTRAWWDVTTELAPCVAIPGIALVTGLGVLSAVLAGWSRGAYSLKRGDILAATTLASLDIFIPTSLAVLLWLLIRSLKNLTFF